MQTSQPIIIAGPCSVESRSQLRAVVSELQDLPQVTLIRCGVWKPRTRPGGFEGLGQTALEWMAELKQENPTLRFCCEVANPTHVELSLRYGIDALWIGARTASNPFSISELTQSLKGIRIPVMVKNPMMPDVNAWMGAIERCQQAAAGQVIAIHRGFDVYNNLGFRNNPLWEIPMELRRRMPQIPILCDPSHITGNSSLVATMSQTALDLKFDGLMIETHCQPQEALTDSLQQVTPAQLRQILASLVVKEEKTGNVELDTLRQKIDTVDQELLTLLSRRLSISKQIAQVKAENQMSIYQPKRWDDVLHQKLEIAQELGLSQEFVKELYEKIHTESVRVQGEKLKNEN